MMTDSLNTAGEPRTHGVLRRLLHDRAGNTLAIMAATMIPLMGMVGGGFDLARLYIVKTRLQHACDAGALAGRKAMGGGTWAYSSFYPRTQAERFFDANIKQDAYGSSGMTRSFSENAGKVTGSAAATVPMTLMRVFGKTAETLTVTCDAEMRLPNTDVMFVLDVTGSMASKAVSSDSLTKIQSLRESVKCFYEIVARLDTDANCTTGAPSGGTGTQVQIRFGFMPYSTNVNVGYLLPTSYFADEWTYQSREPLYKTRDEWQKTGNARVTNESINMEAPQNYCNNTAASSLNSSSETYETTKKKTVTEITYTTDGTYRNGRCYGTKTTTATDYQLTNRKTTEFDKWLYAPITHDIRGLKNGTVWRRTFDAPIGWNGTNRTITWDGCVEERKTLGQTDWRTITADRDIDEAPTAGNAATQWGPALQQLIYLRRIQSAWSEANRDPIETTAEYYNSVPYYCPAEARKLQQWTDANAFSSYVNSLQPIGNTYHDIGMLWGARFMSPTGMFRTENEFTPQGGEIERHMIFMTDGDAVSAPCDYTAYGVGWFDRRTTTDVGTASNCPNERSALSNQVDARLDALCTVVRNKNITLWVISFGSGSNSATEERLEDCASPNRYFVARNSAQLQATFKSIADQISQLRLTN